jgi:hypothetical protein
MEIDMAFLLLGFASNLELNMQMQTILMVGRVYGLTKVAYFFYPIAMLLSGVLKLINLRIWVR